MKRKLIILFSCVFCAIILSLVAFLIFVILGNTCLHVSNLTVNDEDLPDSFDGFRIAHVSDLHNTEFGKYNKRLLKKLREAEPDIIAITGDLIDSNNTDFGVALSFVKEALKIAPCYFVTGNHEGRVDAYGDFEKELISLGAIVLDGKSAKISKNGEEITLWGIHDPESLKGELYGYNEKAIIDKLLSELDYDQEGYNVLLSHRPEAFESYANMGYDLVLTGHAHGGQFRIPFVGGLYAPAQGAFPKYDSGLYTKGTTNMVVSRGLGNSAFPFRINNTPEIVIVTLAK
ncbi:MAG: metallophosphoesterase [Clostridia bacterium]|nr:metallophosphoesterase [Clostridia bacterium]